jgi:hypothetical protein
MIVNTETGEVIEDGTTAALLRPIPRRHVRRYRRRKRSLLDDLVNEQGITMGALLVAAIALLQ